MSRLAAGMGTGPGEGEHVNHRGWERAPGYRQVWVVTARLELAGPLSLSTGMEDERSDQPLLRDGQGRVLIPGTSLLGVLRDGWPDEDQGAADRLFGPRLGEGQGDAPTTDREREDEERGQVAQVWVDDMPLLGDERVQVRDHVRLRNETLVADPQQRAKYDRQVLRGGEFDLRLEWHVPEGAGERLAAGAVEQAPESDRELFVRVLRRLERGIALGGRTRRGLGQMKPVSRFGWRRYDLAQPRSLAEWIRAEALVAEWTVDKIAEELGAKELGAEVKTPEEGEQSGLDLHLRVAGSLAVRDQGRTVPGSSLAGVLRHQVRRIGFLLTEAGGDPQVRAARVEALETWLFGSSPDDRDPRAGQVTVGEAHVSGGQRLSHTRVAIDPWTGGAAEHLLFTTEATYGGTLDLRVRVAPSRGAAGADPDRAAALGLLVLALRDLWEGRLAVGAEGGIGRGQLLGESGTLNGHKLAFRSDGRLVEGPADARCAAWIAAAVKYLEGHHG